MSVRDKKCGLGFPKHLMKIVVLASFVVVLGLFIFATQVPINVTEDEVAKAVTEASSELEVPVDEELVAAVVQGSVAKLEAAQSTRLKYLTAAYFIIWLVFILYLLYLARQQQTLEKRLSQLEHESV